MNGSTMSEDDVLDLLRIGRRIENLAVRKLIKRFHKQSDVKCESSEQMVAVLAYQRALKDILAVIS